MGFEKPSGGEKSAERPEPTKEEMARGIEHVAFEINARLDGIVGKIAPDRLTDIEIARIGREVERYVFREICKVVGIDEATQDRVLGMDSEG